MNIVGIEGNSFSGKSELAVGLEYEHEFIHIKEPSYYVEGFPPPPSDVDSAKKNLLFFADVERRRGEDAMKALESGSEVIMDRTLWTYILYEYVLFAKYPNRPNAFLFSIDTFQRLCDDKNIVVPEILVCLTPGKEEILKQRILQRRPTSIDFLNEWATTVVIDSTLEKMIGIYGPANACQLVNNKGVDELVSSGYNFICNADHSKKPDTEQIFDTLRELIVCE